MKFIEFDKMRKAENKARCDKTMERASKRIRVNLDESDILETTLTSFKELSLIEEK